MVAAATDVVELIHADLAAECVAVNSEDFGGAGLVAVEAFEDPPDEFFFEFGYGFFEQDTALDHHAYERFQLLFHARTLRSDTTGAGTFPWAQSSAWPVIR